MTVMRYTLWCTSSSSWCEYDVVGESHYGATIRNLLPHDWDGGGTEIQRDFELIPEPDNRYDPWAISVRADNKTVGYIQRVDAPQWANVVRRVCASGHIPVVPGRIYAFERPDWENWDATGDPPKDFGATVQLKLGDPATALPLNNPPEVPHTLLPRSTIVQVTKENEHANSLLKFVPPSGYGLLIATLHEHLAASGRSVIEVRIDDECIGQLTPQTSQRFLPLVQHLSRRNLLPACWADITGSAVAAEVRISAIKANEATPSVLDGDAIEVPRLIAEEQDARAYNLRGNLYHVEEAPTAKQPEIRRPPTETPPPLPPAGWYPDPRYPQFLRYWNGAVWTDHTASNPRSTR
ncbi:DUF2510 domain-containing protein [Mycobacterium malmoense]|uniref:DUF2510 domain-containing protein n=1 Tax=Mycobacterium malmoense TaxID=1780 RepID=UPI001C38D9F1|nr:DUF2510 domain-containing protein [Mycobacterium malmoense]QZA18900.1 DUF2510 domain-containing protein [Mycobacterium malmoense]